MESPSIQITNAPNNESMFDVDGPPSSPFISQVDAESRSPSKQWNRSVLETVDESMTVPPAQDQSPSKASLIDFTDIMEDKENMPQQQQEEEEMTATKLSVSPKKASRPVTPELPPQQPQDEQPGTTRKAESRRGSEEADLMPPPTIRKTPRKTPLRTMRSGANTPATLARGNSYERADQSTARTPSQFQKGLDLRASVLQHQAGDATNVDDTCFSTFSEIPEMTLFAKLGGSPTKRGDQSRTPARNDSATPRTTRKRLSSSRSPSPTPRRQKTPLSRRDSDDTTSFLIDFTQQIEGVTRPNAHISPSKTEPDLLRHLNSQRSPAKSRHSIATPAKQSNLMNLLDFELPPAPTPRSVPTITVRELESLKSSYLSQISSLKATLSGREAEVESLKRAVADAERRVGEAQEHLRDERNKREHVEAEKQGWEKRGQEVEAVLQSVKEEVMKGEQEKEDLFRKVSATERRIEDAEQRAIKAEERFADALAARAETGDSSTEDQVQRLVAAQIDAKIEAVSRELHAVYKEKHERKVGTLKKSYEARSEKKTAELQGRLERLEAENADLQAAKDATFSGPLQETPDAELKAQLEEQKAHLARLEHEMLTSQSQQEQLVRELQQERIEKGDLVAAVDEMLALQAETNAASANGGQVQGAMSMVEDFRKSISRPSGLKPPGSESKIGRGGPSGIGRGAPAGGKSRMLANIERMGRTGGAAGAE